MSVAGAIERMLDAFLWTVLLFCIVELSCGPCRGLQGVLTILGPMSVVASRNIRSSFDLGWGGVSHSELLNNISGDACKQQQRLSMQLDQEFLPSDPAELQLQQLQQALLLQQTQQQAEAGAPLQTEMGIDAQIQRLLELKQFLRRTKQATAQQQQQLVILEDIVMAADAGNALDGSASGLFASSALVTPMQSERYVPCSCGSFR